MTIAVDMGRKATKTNKLHGGGSNSRLNNGPDVKLKSVDWCLVLRWINKEGVGRSENLAST